VVARFLPAGVEELEHKFGGDGEMLRAGSAVVLLADLFVGGGLLPHLRSAMAALTLDGGDGGKTAGAGAGKRGGGGGGGGGDDGDDGDGEGGGGDGEGGGGGGAGAGAGAGGGGRDGGRGGGRGGGGGGGNGGGKSKKARLEAPADRLSAADKAALAALWDSLPSGEPIYEALFAMRGIARCGTLLGVDAPVDGTALLAAVAAAPAAEGSTHGVLSSSMRLLAACGIISNHA